MYVNGKWTFCILGQRTCPYFWANHLHMSKDSYEDKSKHLKVKKGTLPVDMRQTKRRLCLSSISTWNSVFKKIDSSDDDDSYNDIVTLNAKSMYIVNEDMIIVVVLAKWENFRWSPPNFCWILFEPWIFWGVRGVWVGGDWLVCFFTILFCLFV